jgi:hypothetical protein
MVVVTLGNPRGGEVIAWERTIAAFDACQPVVWLCPCMVVVVVVWWSVVVVWWTSGD